MAEFMPLYVTNLSRLPFSIIERYLKSKEKVKRSGLEGFGGLGEKRKPSAARASRRSELKSTTRGC
jgi:hypothetical protein